MTMRTQPNSVQLFSCPRQHVPITICSFVVLDPARTVVYHGAVDDQYGFGYSRAEPRHTYLTDALTAILNENSPPTEATTAPGCQLEIRRDDPAAEAVTYHGRISRVIDRHCVECHREGQIAPVVLTRARALYQRKLRQGEVSNPCYLAKDATRPSTSRGGQPGRRFYVICDKQKSFRAVSSGYETRQQRVAEPGRSAASFAAKPRSDIAIGAMVEHAKFGTGCVIDQEGNKLTIQFEEAGEKRVIDSFVTVVE